MEWYFKVLFIWSVVTPNLVNGQFGSNLFSTRQTQSTQSTQTQSRQTHDRQSQQQSGQTRQGYQIPQPIATALSPGFQIKIPGKHTVFIHLFSWKLVLIRFAVFPSTTKTYVSLWSGVNTIYAALTLDCFPIWYTYTCAYYGYFGWSMKIFESAHLSDW